MAAIDQRVAILKAVFVEVNGDQPDAFLDHIYPYLGRYDQAGKMAKKLLNETDPGPESKETTTPI